MRNFKLYTIYLILSFLTISNNALANIDGYFYDITLSSNDISHEVLVNDINSSGQLNNNGTTPLFSLNFDNTSTGISAKVGRKFTNIITDSFFIAPSIAYDYIDSNVTDSNGFKYT